MQNVATCQPRVHGDEQTSIGWLAPCVIEVSYIDSADNVVKHVYDALIVAGDYQRINGRDSVKPSFPANIEERYNREASIDHQCSATND